MKLKSLLYGPLGVDLRSLAFFRVALALMIIADLIDRAEDLSVFYTDGGILPRAPLIERYTNVWHLSVHLMNGTWQVQAALFLIAGLVALALLVGWRTRLMSVLTWFLLISLHARNPMILQAGDVLLRLLAFWAMWLPLGARFSVDAGLGTDETKIDNAFVSVASAALLMQVGFVYWFTIALKSGHDWWPDGTAVYYALHIDLLATRLGVWLRQYGDLLHGLTYASMAAELLLPVLLLFPTGSPRLRLIGIAGLAGMHMSFGLFLELGNFPWIDLVSLTPFIPACVWDWAGARLRTPKRVGATLQVPAGLGERLARVGRSLALLKETRIETREPGTPLAIRAQDGQVYTGPQAWTEAARLSPLGGPAAASVVRTLQRFPRLPTWPRRGDWTWFLGRVLQGRPMRIRPTAFGQLGAALILGLVFWWNLTTIPRLGIRLPQNVVWLANVLRVDQQWGMFAPFPLKDDGWFVAEGTLRDKTLVDVTAPSIRPATFEKPELVSATFSNQRWRKYMMNLWAAVNKSHRLYYARYLCRSWNARYADGQQLEEFHLYYMKEVTLPDYQPSKVEKVEIWHHFCFK